MTHHTRLQSVLQDFVSSQMVFHARGLEVLSESFGAISTVTENDDLKWILDLKKSYAIGDTAGAPPLVRP